MPVDIHSPMGALLISYILDVLKKLPSEKEAALGKLDLPSKLNVTASDWREAIRQALHLAPTFDLAVLDLWYRNREELGSATQGYSPEDYAVNFIEEYYREGSQIDQWSGDALEAARQRVAKYRNSEQTHVPASDTAPSGHKPWWRIW